MPLLPNYPVPAPAGTPDWVGVLFVVGAVAVVGVLLWQTVRFFRNNRDE